MPHHGFTHEYHSAQVETWEFEENEVCFSMVLAPRGNRGESETALLSFREVRNMTEVRSFFECFRNDPAGGRFVDELINIRKLDGGIFLVKFSRNGELLIESSRQVEI